jgi:SAM-dependent methyltransferase
MIRPASGPKPFDADAIDNQGYRYTTFAPHSAIVANQRLTDLTIDWLKQLKKAKKVTRCVDVGCGDGIYTAQVSQAVKGVRMLGTDPAKSAIKLAEKQFSQLKFTVSDLLKPKSLPQPKPNAAIVRGVIHHVPDAEKGVANAVLYAPYVLIIEPNGWNPILKIIEILSPYHRAHGERSFTSYSLKKWVHQAGSKVSRVYYVGLVPFFCPPKLVPVLKRIEPNIEQSFLAPLLCAQVILEIEPNKLDRALHLT